MQLASAGASLSPVDTSLRQNLQQVDEFIADCEQRVKEQPSDELAREYLTNAYQQKAQLISAMMDRGGSLN
jgi:protein involved in temperature-dependent protein secretion